MEKVEEKEVKEMLAKCLTEGNAEIRLRDHKRTGSITVRDYTVLETGEYKKFVDKFGNIKVTRFTKNRTYNLSDPTQALEYEHVKNHPIYTNGPTPILECVNVEEVAQADVYQKDMEAEANYIVRKLSGEKLRDFARLLLIGKRIIIGEQTSDNVIKREIYNLAEDSNPGGVSGAQKIVNAWENPDRNIRELLEKGVANTTFMIKDGVYYYGKQKMGTTKEYAIEWFNKNNDILPQIRKEINSKK
tara:strand:- start:12523 stop:13257 length:735 start_codon:yes stop_codon:yes gene_type:complete